MTCRQRAIDLYQSIEIALMAKEYVSQQRTGYVIEDTRVSLDSVVYAFLRGESPEGIVESFPALTLEQVYGGLSYYLAHREAIDEYLSEGKEEFVRLREESRHKNPSLYARLAEARQKTQRPGA
jgi:uncharacterized protein (DUF433 family)